MKVVIDIEGQALLESLVVAISERPELGAKLGARLLAALAHGDEAAPLLSPKAFAKRNSIGPSTVGRAMREGRLPFIRHGRSVRIAADATIAPVKAPEVDRRKAAIRRTLGLVAGGVK